MGSVNPVLTVLIGAHGRHPVLARAAWSLGSKRDALAAAPRGALYGPVLEMACPNQLSSVLEAWSGKGKWSMEVDVADIRSQINDNG